MTVAAPELAAILAASRPAPAPAGSGAGGAQVVFGLLLLGVGIFLAWLFATGRLHAVQTAIATGVAPAAILPATPSNEAGNESTQGGGFGTSTTTVNAPAQAGAVGSIGITYDAKTGNLIATPATSIAAGG